MDLLLLLGLLSPALEVIGQYGVAIRARHEDRCISEEIPHLLTGTLGSLGRNTPEVDCVGEVANLENLVSESPQTMADTW